MSRGNNIRLLLLLIIIIMIIIILIIMIIVMIVGKCRIGSLPELSSRRTSAGIVLVGRLGVQRIYIYIYICIYIYIYRERDRYVCICVYIYIYTHCIHIILAGIVLAGIILVGIPRVRPVSMGCSNNDFNNLHFRNSLERKKITTCIRTMQLKNHWLVFDLLKGKLLKWS